MRKTHVGAVKKNGHGGFQQDAAMAGIALILSFYGNTQSREFFRHV